MYKITNMKTKILFFLCFFIFLNSYSQWNQLKDFGVNYIDGEYYPNSVHVNGIYFPTNEVGYAYGYETVDITMWGSYKLLFKTINSSESWNALLYSFMPNDLYYHSFVFYNADIGYRIYDTYGQLTLQKTIDGGNNWNDLKTIWADFGIKSINAINDSIGYFFTNNLEISDSTYCIVKFNETAFDTIKVFNDKKLISLLFKNETLAYITYTIDFSWNGVAKKVLRTNDGGNTWIDIFEILESSIKSIHFPSDSVGYIFSDSNQIYKTIDYGDSWQEIDFPITGKINKFQFSSENIGYAIGDSGLILKTIDGGINWMTENSGVTSNLLSLACPSDSVSYILTSDNKIISNRKLSSISNQNIENEELIVYPNPATNELKVESKKLKIGSKLELYDLFGQKIITKELNNSTISIDISQVPAGVYVYKISTDKEALQSGKVMVMK